MEKAFLKQAMDDYEEGRPALTIAQVKKSWGEWLYENWEWEWYATLTFRENVGIKRADALWRKWYTQLVTETGKDVQYVRFAEWQRHRGVLHYHALLLNVKYVRRLKWMDRWNAMAGFARIYAYDSKKGATFYLSKYVASELGEVVFSDGLKEYSVSANRPVQLEFS